jgi:hypothetical protein
VEQKLLDQVGHLDDVGLSPSESGGEKTRQEFADPFTVEITWSDAEIVGAGRDQNFECGCGRRPEPLGRACTRVGIAEGCGEKAPTIEKFAAHGVPP